MGSPRDYYEILGITRDADSVQIKKAFRKLALEYHPDRNPSEEAVLRFREAQEAYEVLIDDQKRALYNQFGHAGVRGSMRTEGGFGPMDDIFEGFQSIFDDFFGGSRRRSQKGADLRYRLKIEFREAVLGCERQIKVRRHRQCTECDGNKAEKGSKVESCPQCQGTGRLRRSQGFFVIAQDCLHCRGSGKFISKPCSKCKASGFEEESAEIKVKVPGGVDSGVRLRLSEEGEVSESGGSRGDLFVEIEVEEDEVFERDAQHLYTSMTVPFTMAIFGGEIEVPLIEGSKTVNLKPFKESPFILVLENEGATDLRSEKRGNLYVELQIEIPEKLSKRAKELLEELQSELEVKKERKQRKKAKKTFFGL